MKRLVLTSALVTVLAVPAYANDQLAQRAGVEPGMYSTVELMRLIRAQEEGDAQTEMFILEGGAEIVSTQSFDAKGHPGINETANRIFEERNAE